MSSWGETKGQTQNLLAWECLDTLPEEMVELTGSAEEYQSLDGCSLAVLIENVTYRK